MQILDATIANPEKRKIEDCYQALAHAVIRQSIDDQKIDPLYHKKKLRKYLTRPKKDQNREVINHYKKEVLEAIEDRQNSIDFMSNGIDLETWVAVAFAFQLNKNKTRKDIEDFTSFLRNKAKKCSTVRHD